MSFQENSLEIHEQPAKCNTTKPGLVKEGIGFGSSLYRFTWFGKTPAVMAENKWLNG